MNVLRVIKNKDLISPTAQMETSIQGVSIFKLLTSELLYTINRRGYVGYIILG